MGTNTWTESKPAHFSQVNYKYKQDSDSESDSDSDSSSDSEDEQPTHKPTRNGIFNTANGRSNSEEQKHPLGPRPKFTRGSAFKIPEPKQEFTPKHHDFSPKQTPNKGFGMFPGHGPEIGLKGKPHKEYDPGAKKVHGLSSFDQELKSSFKDDFESRGFPEGPGPTLKFTDVGKQVFRNFKDLTAPKHTVSCFNYNLSVVSPASGTYL